MLSASGTRPCCGKLWGSPSTTPESVDGTAKLFFLDVSRAAADTAANVLTIFKGNFFIGFYFFRRIPRLLHRSYNYFIFHAQRSWHGVHCFFSCLINILVETFWSDHQSMYSSNKTCARNQDLILKCNVLTLRARDALVSIFSWSSRLLNWPSC